MKKVAIVGVEGRRTRRPLRRPQDFCEASFPDFTGEVYRAAFGDKEGFPRREIAASVESLNGYVKRADVLMVGLTCAT